MACTSAPGAPMYFRYKGRTYAGYTRRTRGLVERGDGGSLTTPFLRHYLAAVLILPAYLGWL